MALSNVIKVSCMIILLFYSYLFYLSLFLYTIYIENEK